MFRKRPMGKICGVIAMALVMVMCLPLLGGAHAESAQPLAANLPAEGELSQQEDNIPVEIDPKPDGAPYKAGASVMKDEEPVWIIRAGGTYTQVNLPKNPKGEYNYDFITDVYFEAVKRGDDYAYGAYQITSNSLLDLTVDYAAYCRDRDYEIEGDYHTKGPLTDLKLDLFVPLARPSELEGYGTVNWAPMPIADYWKSPYDSGTLHDTLGFNEQVLSIVVKINQDGNGTLRISGSNCYGYATILVYPVRLTKMHVQIDG